MDDAIEVDGTTSETTETTLETNPEISGTVGVEESEQEESTTEDAPQKVVTQEAVTALMGRQHAKFKRKLEGQTDTAHDAVKRAETAEETARLLQLALDQKSTQGPPVADDYDGGEYDPKFVTDREQFTADNTAKLVRDTINSTMLEHVTANDAAVNQRAQADARQQRQVKHYEQALKLQAPDYEDAEIAVIDQLGIGVVEEIIEREKDSAAMIYFLNKNPDRAQELKSALNSSPYEGVIAIGNLRRDIKPATKSSTAPTPIDKVESSRSASSGGGLKGATYT